MKSKEEILDELVPDSQIKMAQGNYQPGDKVLVKDVTGATFRATLVQSQSQDVGNEGTKEGWTVKPDSDAIASLFLPSSMFVCLSDIYGVDDSGNL